MTKKKKQNGEVDWPENGEMKWRTADDGRRDSSEEREQRRERRERGTHREKKKKGKMEEEEEPWPWYINQGYSEDILSSL